MGVAVLKTYGSMRFAEAEFVDYTHQGLANLIVIRFGVPRMCDVCCYLVASPAVPYAINALVELILGGYAAPEPILGRAAA